MSTPPPVPAQSGMPTWLKWILGLTIGCFVLVVACCGGTCLFGRAMLGDVFGKLQRADEVKRASRESSSRVAGLDVDHPPRIPEDVATAELTDEDVLRYLRIRKALAPAAAEYQKVVDGAISSRGGSLGVVRDMVGMVSASLDANAARAKLLDAAEPALRAESMGPQDFERMLEIVEWRYLQREEARPLGLDESDRREYAQLQLEVRMLDAWLGPNAPMGMRVNGRSRADAERDLEREKNRLAELGAKASTRTALSGTTIAVLQAHREELAALPTDGLQAMAPLTEEPPIVGFTEGGHGVQFEREGHWSTGESHESPDEPAPASATGP